MMNGREEVKTNALTVVDLFCGAGGLSTGFSNAILVGHNVIARFGVQFAVDRNKHAVKTFSVNHPGVPTHCGDISQVDAAFIRNQIGPGESVDVLIGGPSCQGVSPAGLRNPEDKRNQTLLAFIRLVDELRPKWFVMENVPGLIHENNRELLAEIFRRLSGIEGYKVVGDVLLAADYGIPQFRYRLFIIGTRTKSPIRFPSPTHFEPANQGALLLPTVQRYLTVRDAIFDLEAVEPGEYDSSEAPEAITAGRAIANHECQKITDANRRRISHVRAGYDWRDMPIGLLPERYFATRSSDQKGAYGRLHWDWPAYTVTNSSLNITSGAFTHPEKDRCLSVREVARLQSFPDGYVFHGSIQAQYMQVGNAVPPKLAQAVAEEILFCNFDPVGAKRRGREGRLTLELIEDCIAGRREFPVMTPRQSNPAHAPRQTRRKTQGSRAHKQQNGNGESQTAKSVWDARTPPLDIRPKETKRLRRLAEQPANVKAAKRAKAIVQFIDGMPREEIVATANVSERSVKKWIDGYFAAGLDGWRAHHSRLDHIADQKLLRRIEKNIARVRRVLLAPIKEHRGKGSPKRLHMNSYLLGLIARFKDYPVYELIEEVETRLSTGVGTVYIGDLLAIADAVIPATDARVEDPVEIVESIPA